MSLIKLSSQTFGASSSVTYTGLSSAYDVHVMRIRKVRASNVNSYLDARFTTATGGAGTPITSANYRYAGWYDHSQFGIGKLTSTAQSYTDKWRFTYISQNTTGDGYDMELWIYNAASSSDFTYAHWKSVGQVNASAVGPYMGGCSLIENTAVDGIQIFPTSGGAYNIPEAEITLYGLQES